MAEVNDRCFRFFAAAISWCPSETLQSVESYHAYRNSIKQWGSPSLFLSSKRVKLKKRVSITVCIFAVVACYTP